MNPNCTTCGGKFSGHVRTGRGMAPCPECYDHWRAANVPVELRGADVTLPLEHRRDEIWKLTDGKRLGESFDAFRYRAWDALAYHMPRHQGLVVKMLDVARVVNIQFERDEEFSSLTELTHPGLLIITVPRASGRHRNPPELAQVLDNRRRAGKPTWVWSDLTPDEFADDYAQAAALLAVRPTGAAPQAVGGDPEPPTPPAVSASKKKLLNNKDLKAQKSKKGSEPIYFELNSGATGLKGLKLRTGDVVTVEGDSVTVGNVIWEGDDGMVIAAIR